MRRVESIFSHLGQHQLRPCITALARASAFVALQAHAGDHSCGQGTATHESAVMVRSGPKVVCINVMALLCKEARIVSTHTLVKDRSIRSLSGAGNYGFRSKQLYTRSWHIRVFWWRESVCTPGSVMLVFLLCDEVRSQICLHTTST